VASNKGIALEVTHNVLNGDIPDNLTQITKVARLMNWHTHLDGARLFNGMVVKQWEGPEIGKEFDSLCVSLSKGLGCPIGSVLLGEEGFIEEARYY
jgi:threonine aldolase